MKTAKLTTLTFFTVAMGAAAVAFGGCTVTSGTVNDTEGGTGSSGTSGTSGSSGNSEAGTDGGSDSAAPKCEGNKQTVKLVDDACQACLEANCCDQLKGCFNIVQTPTDGGFTPDNCDKFAECIAKSTSAQDQQDCVDVTTQNVVDAYDQLFDKDIATSCVAKNAACKTACKIP